LSDKLKKFSKKFAYRWTGPYKILKVLSSLTYELEIPNSNFKVHNVKNLKKYYERPSSDMFNDNSGTNIVSQSQTQSSIETDCSPPGSVIVPRYNLRSRKD